jgi:hypothetical protein
MDWSASGGSITETGVDRRNTHLRRRGEYERATPAARAARPAPSAAIAVRDASERPVGQEEAVLRPSPGLFR